MRVRLPGVLLAFLGAIFWILPAPAQAHVLKTSSGFVYFNTQKGTLGINIQLNLEAALAGISPELARTEDSPNANEYNQLRALPPEALKQRFAAFRQEFLDGLRLTIDGKPARLSIVRENFREVGDMTKPRYTAIVVETPWPPEAKAFTFGWDKRFGRIALRTGDRRVRTMKIEMIDPGQTSSAWVIDDIKARSTFDMIKDFLKIGYTHIVPEGTDHILFVLGIFLLSIKLRPILIQVTSFTVAHTLTLGLGTAGIVNLPPSIVEPLIAASIVYVAVENILRPTLSPWRPVIVFLFGLLHGLGFAGILQEIGIPKGDFLLGLLSFNVGVELGQLSVIAVAYLLVGLWFGKKPWYRQRVVIPGSLLIALIGAFWFIQRVFFTY